MLQERAHRCVCKFCGSELRLKRLTFSHEKSMRIEIFCQQCNRIEYGVEKETYLCAKNFVETLGFQYYQDVEEGENSKRMNIAKVCEIISWADKKRGFLDENGYTLPTNASQITAGELIVMMRDQVEQLLTEGDSDVQ